MNFYVSWFEYNFVDIDFFFFGRRLLGSHWIKVFFLLSRYALNKGRRLIVFRGLTNLFNRYY